MWFGFSTIFSSVVLAHSVLRQLERLRLYGMYWPHTRGRLWWTLISLLILAFLDTLALLLVGLALGCDHHLNSRAYAYHYYAPESPRYFKAYLAISALWMCVKPLS